MAIRDLFRPKREPDWKSPDLNVRLNAVRHLRPEDSDLIRILAREDPAAPVRRAALRKIHDAAVVIELLGEEKDESVREEACSILVTTATSNGNPEGCAAALAALQEPRHVAIVAKAATLETIRRAAVARLADAKALGQVAREAEDAATRLAALAKIQDAAVLGGIAQGSEHKDVAVAAVERLTGADAETLRAIMTRGRNKAAARRARALLETLAPTSASVLSPHERRRHQVKLCENLETLARSHDWVRLAREVADAEPTWREAGEGAEAAVTQRFEAARRIVEARVTAHQKEITEAETRQRGREESLSVRTQLCERAETADGTTSLEELRGAWDALPPTDDAEAKGLARRFDQALARVRSHREEATAAQSLQPQAEALCTEAEAIAKEDDLREAGHRMRAVERRWAEAHGGRPASLELAERLQTALGMLKARQAETRVEREKQSKDNASRLEILCVQLETLAAHDKPNLRDADKALRECREVLDDLGPLASKEQRDAFTARLKSARQALYPKVQELKDNADWQQFANVTIQEGLCAQVEAMLPREDLEAVAQELRDIDVKWKQASSVPKDKGEALWQRFRTAREALRTRCDAYFAAKAAELAENARKKEALCARASALAESTDWVKTAQEIQALQTEWKTIGPVARAQSNPLWERFHKACDAFFRRRKQDRTQRREEWKGNRERKEALCVQAEALADSTDWDATAAELKKLQVEWKAVGPADRQHSEVLWQRFRGACNRFFDRFGKRHDLDRARQADVLEGLCRELEALIPESDAAPAEDVAARVSALQAAWKQAGSVPEPRMTQLVNRFTSARARVVTTFEDAFRGTDLDPESNRKKMEKLCVRVETVAGELSPRRADTTASLVEQLRNALASNTIGGKEAADERVRAAVAEVEAAREAWKRIGPVNGEGVQALSERFERACAKVLSERPREQPREKPRERSAGTREPRTASPRAADRRPR